FFGIAYIASGFLLINGVPHSSVERKTTGVLLIIWGLHKFDYPFLWPYENYRSWGYLISAMITFIAAISMIFTYLKGTQDLLIAERIKAEDSDRLKSSFLA